MSGSIILLSGCKDQQQDNDHSSSKEMLYKLKESRPANFPRYWNDVARYLGGMPPEPDSLLTEQSRQPAFLSHQKYFNESWQKGSARLQKLNIWRDVQLADANQSDRKVFYPFSGPDFLNIFAFYPNAPRYFMFGLEKPGSEPDIRKHSPENQKAYLQNLQISLRAIMSWSFFRTKAMKVNFNNQVMDGLNPVILAFMARHGLQILDLTPVRIKPDGKLYAIYTGPFQTAERDLPDYNQPVALATGDSMDPKKDPIPHAKKAPHKKISKQIGQDIPGIRIRFQVPGQDRIRDVIFFSFNASNEGLRTYGQIEDFVKANCPCNTYLKAASYLMHAPGFSHMRKIVLGNSDFLLQDDSGIPVRHFSRKDWDLTFYGTYKKPIRLFKIRVQNDLQKIYNSGDVQILPFGVGYKWQQGTSNLMRARKRTATSEKKIKADAYSDTERIKDSMAVGRGQKQPLKNTRLLHLENEAMPTEERSTGQPDPLPENMQKYGSL